MGRDEGVAAGHRFRVGQIAYDADGTPFRVLALRDDHHPSLKGQIGYLAVAATGPGARPEGAPRLFPENELSATQRIRLSFSTRRSSASASGSEG